MARGAGGHYRVARREIERNANTERIYLPKQKKEQLFISIFLLAVAVFFKGIIIGIWLNKKR